MDEEIERRARAYAGNDFRERRKVVVNPVCWCGNEEMPLGEFLEFIAMSVPEEYKASALVSYESGAYDEGDTFKVTYERMETDEDVATRINNALNYAQSSLHNDRALYEQLKKKFDHK